MNELRGNTSTQVWFCQVENDLVGGRESHNARDAAGWQRPITRQIPIAHYPEQTRMIVHMPRKRETATALLRQHRNLCFARAFPRSQRERDSAHRQLLRIQEEFGQFAKSRHYELTDSGIAGTQVRYRFSFDVARWLARKSPGAVSIDWSDLDDCELLDDLLRRMLLPCEDEHFDSGYTTTRDWIRLVSAGFQGTDFDWLMAQMQHRRLRTTWRELYDAADVPLVWDLGRSRHSKSRNVLSTQTIDTRERGMRQRPANVKKEILRPLTSIAKVSKRRGAALIDVAMASLAARHRETYHFNFANPDEAYLADVGEGVNVAVFGLRPEHRFPLECTMGFLILANGVPVGYGGSSIAFKQINTGINVFDEYRGSEAAYLWVQVMRVYHSLVGCTRFIANAYQIGEGNREALQSGAFWFYYRLGFRPVSHGVRALALKELAKRHRDPGYRSKTKTLRDLAGCDMHLTLPGSRPSELFNEEWLATSSKLATREIGMAGGKTRQQSATLLMNRVSRDLCIGSLDGWTTEEKRSFSALAPFVAAANPQAWPAFAKRSMRKIVRAKGGIQEAIYARNLCQDEQLLMSLRNACQRDATAITRQ